MSTTRSFADEGGLMAYQEYTRDTEQCVAVFVDKILKGAKPADPPVEQPTKFELVVQRSPTCRAIARSTLVMPGRHIPSTFLSPFSQEAA
jgi:putative ABC transport system substrate-binding protein